MPGRMPADTDMTIQLTPEQWSDISHIAETPIRVSDPKRLEHFVLVRTEVYDRLRPLFEDVPVGEEERKFQLQEFGKRAGWDDPLMDIYEDLDPRRQG